MAYKEFALPVLGNFKVYKRKGAHSLRLSITVLGEVRVSQPVWLPYSAGVNFAQTKAAWIIENRRVQSSALIDGQRVGKLHYLQFAYSPEAHLIKTRIVGADIIITLPVGHDSASKEAQEAAQKASERALKKECPELLGGRLNDLAVQFGFSYETLSYKKLKGRWGSCSNRRHITLNIFLLELPWHLIDYVLVHELVHTKHLNHSSEFWLEFERCISTAKQLRKEIHRYQPKIGASHAT